MLVGPGCIVHLPLTTVGVCVDPVGVGQVYVGGVEGNVQITIVRSSLRVTLPPGILLHSRAKIRIACEPAVATNDAVHVPSVGVAGWPPTLMIVAICDVVLKLGCLGVCNNTK